MLPLKIWVVRQFFHDLTFDIRDVLDHPDEILEDCQDTHLSYGAVWLCEYPSQGCMVHVYQKWLLGSVQVEFAV